MKKLFALLALVLGMVSCQNEPEALDVVVGGEQEVMLNVSIPESTRANSAEGFDFDNLGDYKVRYILEISYNGNLIRDVQISKEKSVKFPVRLAPNRDYTFTVWADLVTATSVDKENWHETDNYYNTENGLANIELQNWTPNTEARDAWTATTTVEFGPANKNISLVLKRPFAKVRVVATDIAEIRKFGIEPTNAVAEYAQEMYTEFDAVAGAAKGVTTGKKHTFDYVAGTYEVANSEQLTLFADYVLVPADGNVQFTLSVYDNTKGANALIKTNNFNTTIPVVANKVTSIVGNVLTEGGNVSITVDGVLGNHETFNYIDTAEALLAAMNEDGNFILGGDIELSNAPVAGQASRRNTANQAKKTTIDLNGHTITINNKGTEPLVTVAAGNTLTFAGAGNIVMTSESTAPFVENKNENGGVIIEEAKVTNESTNQEATIVDGTAVVNEGVEIEGNVASGETTSQLDYVLANGGEVTLLQDVTSDKILEISATNPVVINGNGKTLTSSAGRAINVSGANDVTIKNLNIVASGERAINVIQNSKKVTIENVTATAANYTVNVATSAPGAVVTIKNSTLNGLCTVNVASAGAEVTVDGSTVNCNDNDTTEGEAYAALSLNREAVGGKIIATNSTINVAEGSDSIAGRNGAEDGVVTINGSVEGVAVMNAVITYSGSDYYYAFQTIQKAVDFAKSGDVISLIRDVKLTEPLEIAKDKNVVLDLNGKTITGTDSATSNFGLITNQGTLTVKNGTITLVAENDREWNAYSSVISNNPGGNLVVENVTIEHLGGTSMAYGIDNLTNGKGTYAETTVNSGAVVKSPYRAIRQFLNGIEAQNILTVNTGAVVEGTNKSIWMQDPSANANTGKLVVNEGARLNGDVYLSVTAGSTEWPVEVSIADSAVNGEVLTGSYVPAGYKLVNESGVWTVIACTEVSTVEELEAALTNNVGGEVKLTADINLGAPVIIAEGKKVVLNLNGKTLTATGYAIENYGTLTINGDGTINGVVYGENGTTTVENGTFNPADGGAYVFLNSTAGTLIINGGTINTGSSYPVYSYNENNKLIINDVTINGKFGCVNAYGTNGSVEINGGTFQMTGVQGNTSHITYFSSNIVATINGGTFKKIGDISMSATGGGGICVNGGANLTINGGTFAGDHDDVYNYGGTISVKGGEYKFMPDFVAEGYVATQENGKYVVVAK